MSGSVVAICMEGVGHIQCLLPVIEGLRRRGCDVTAMTKPEYAPLVRDAGAQFVDLYDGCPLDAADAESMPVPSRFVTFAAVYAEALTARVDALSPSLVLYDTFTVVAPVVARALGVPSVNVSTNHAAVPERVIATLRVDERVAISEACFRAVATLRDVHGVKNASPFMYVDNLSPSLNLYAQPPQFLVPEDRAAFEPLAFFGCLREKRADRAAAPVFGPRRGRRVYVSFGTVIWWYFAEAAVAALRSLVQALSGTDAEVVISLGNHPLDDEARATLAAPSVRVLDYVDQLAVLDEADVIVTHHGVNSTHEAIQAGVPMLSYPFFGDQPDLALRCQDLGLAVPLTDEPRGAIDEGAVHRALARLDQEREQLDARLAVAQTWEEETIAGRPAVLDRLVALMDQRERSDDPTTSRRHHHVAAVERLLPDAVSRIDWSPARLQEQRTAALRALLTTAVEQSSWHRQRLEGLDISSLSDRDIVELPVMTKTDLMDNFDAIVTDARLSRRLCEDHLDRSPGNHLLGEFQVVASGGSSGTQGVYVYGWDAWAICYASNVRFQVRDWGRDPTLAGIPRVIGVVAASSPTHISAALSKTFSSGDNARHLFPVSLPLEAIVAGLNELQPTVLMGYSSLLPRLALEAQRGRLHITPRRVIAISEPLLPEARQVVHETWGVPIANGYGMSEGVFTGFCGHGIHLPDDVCIFEPVDANGRPVGPGVLSHRVLVTNLYNHTQPLIRYEVTDQVILVEGTCACGSSFRRIEDPQGRLDDIFEYADGLSVHPHVFRSALGQHPAVLEYEVRQTRRGAAIRIVTTAPVDVRALEAKIADALAALGLVDSRVTIEIVAAIPRHASGKLKRFVPLSS